MYTPSNEESWEIQTYYEFSMRQKLQQQYSDGTGIINQNSRLKNLPHVHVRINLRNYEISARSCSGDTRASLRQHEKSNTNCAPRCPAAASNLSRSLLQLRITFYARYFQPRLPY